MIANLKNKSISIISNYQNECFKIHVKIIKKFKVNNFFHYTNISSVKNILISKELWSKDFKRLNDPMEIICSYEVIRESINKYVKKSNKNSFWSTFFSVFEKNYIKESNLYVCSFSDECDYLPCWRWYGDNGKGACIKFDQISFEDNGEDYGDFVKTKLIYDRRTFDKYIEEFFILTNRYLNKLSCVDYQCLAENLLSNLLSLMPMYKNDGYKYESEIRIYILELKVNGVYYPNELPVSRKCCSKDDGIIDTFRSPYFNVSQVSEIWLGPCCDFEKEKNDISNILIKEGYDCNKVKILQSKHHYRG